MRERLAAGFVGLMILAVAAVLLALIDDARTSGVRSLEGLLQSEIEATARSQNKEVEQQLGAGLAFIQQPWELTVGSESDKAQLDILLDLFGDAIEFGFFLTDSDGRVTQGALLGDDVTLGDVYEHEGMAEALVRMKAGQPFGSILPVGASISTPLPSTPSVYPILNPETGELRGTFVSETPVEADSTFNLALAELQKGETGEYLFIDSAGGVVASSNPALIATQIDEGRFLTEEAGLYDIDGKIVAIADVPAAGWRLVFRQDRGEFQSDLTGPLQSVGLLLVVVSFVAAAIMFFFLSRQLRAAREEQARLAELAASQEEFISIVSHELRTPVSGILGFLQTTLDHWEQMGDEERRTAVHRASTNARRLQSLTRDVLDSQSLEAGALGYAFSDVDLVDEVTGAVEAARDSYGDRTIELDVGELESLGIRGDADRLQQVFGNLLDNAHKLSPASEPIDVKVSSVGDEAHIEITDRGPGLTPDMADKVFDKFVRGRSTGPTGTGLGLYISRQIVEAHDGRIWVDTDVESGARFVVAIPLRSSSE